MAGSRSCCCTWGSQPKIRTAVSWRSGCELAIYARYSSDLQCEASIDDQVRACRVELERHGWELVEVYADPRISGASTFRPGYQKLLLDASRDASDLVVAEGLDRLSRDLADIATL